MRVKFLGRAVSLLSTKQGERLPGRQTAEGRGEAREQGAVEKPTDGGRARGRMRGAACAPWEICVLGFKAFTAA